MKFPVQSVAAAALAALLGFAAQPAHPQAGRACAGAPDELERHLASNSALERLHALRADIDAAAEQTGHSPRALVSGLFAEPLAIAGESPAASLLRPQATPIEFSPRHASPLNAVIDRLDEVQSHLDTALSGITDEQAHRLRLVLPALLDRTSSGKDLEEIEDGFIVAEIQAALDPDAFAPIAELLAGLARGKVAATLSSHFRAQPARPTPAWLDTHITGSVVLAEQRSIGPVIVGGVGNNVYTGPAAVIIDLGGNDIYTMAAGGQVRIIIDLEGNDSYVARTDGALSGAVLGASLIADHAGDDVYAGGRISQGASVAGVGMLQDHAGNDRYFAGELAQGASLAGIGVLHDFAGNDVYTATKFAQAFGGAMGIGILVDHAGGDAYLAGNKYPSSYGLTGNFQAFSQGVGMGFRHDIAGGIGLLHDLGGNDRYVAGNFSQGAGYYLGAGLLIDTNGQDAYSGGRYTQGAAAHLGVGLLRDERGDDTYSARPSAGQGGAWDRALAALVDCAGDDDYTANEFALGAAAQNAIAFFFDAAGENQFTARRNARGHEGPSDYHEDGARIGNVAVFVDGDAADAATDDSLHQKIAEPGILP